MGIFGNMLSGGGNAETTVKVNYDGKDAQQGLSGLKTTIKQVVTAYAIKQTIEFSAKLATLGATAESVDKSFTKFSNDRGRDYTDMMMKLRRATMGTVSDMELQQKAMQAMISGINFNDVIVAMDYVTKYALTTGTDVSSKIATVMTGLARGSAQFMDDVGIQVIGSKDVITDTINQMQEKVGQFNITQDEGSIKVAEFTARIKNLTAELGKKLVPALSATIDFLNKMMDGMNFVFRGEGVTKFTEQQKEMAKTGTKLIDINKKIAYLEEQKANFATRYYITDKKTNKEKNISVHEYNGIMASGMEQAVFLGKEELKMIDLIGQKNELLIAAKKHRQESLEVTKKINLEGERSKKPVADKKEKAREAGYSPEMAYLLIQSQMAQDAKNAFLQIQKEKNEQTIEAEKTLQDVMIETLADGKNKEIELLNLKYSDYEKAYAENKEALKLIANAKDLELEQIEQTHQDNILSIQQQAALERTQIANATLNSLTQVSSSLIALQDVGTQKELANIRKSSLSQERKAQLEADLQKKAMERQKVYMRLQQALIISKATMDTISAGLGVFQATPGEFFMKSLAMGTALTTGFLQVAKIEAQQFRQDKKRNENINYRAVDDRFAVIGAGGTIIDAPASSRRSGALEAIANNTADTAAGMRSISGNRGQVINNFYGLSSEQLVRAKMDIERRNYTGDIL